MKRTLLSGLLSVALTSAAFAQAGNQNQTQDRKSKDDTNFQKGNTDPTDPANQKKDNRKKKGKNQKSGKNKKGPIAPQDNPTSPTNNPPRGNGPTIPPPTTPTTPPATR